MDDIASTEDDSDEVRAKYVKLEEDIRTCERSELSECTFYTLATLVPISTYFGL